ncbi:hypothetical protein C2S51_020556 [Perilla frutescens var. frutescens]|nr:hypothetical protein C2S51_020556 [Perilla frutescens var. frutescens]
MWGYVCGTHSKPIEAHNEKFVEQIDVWEVNNSKIITWINNSVENSIDMQLAKYDTVKEVWDHLERLYTQSNFAKQYQLEMDVRSLNQKEMSIQEFYSAMTNLWDQGNILHRSPLPSVDSVVSELLAEEVRHKSRVMKGLLPSPNPSIFAAHSRPLYNPSHKNQSRPNSKVTTPNECNFYHQSGHWKAQCPLLVYKQAQSGPRGPPFPPPQYHQRPSRQSPLPNVTVVAMPPSDAVSSGSTSSSKSTTDSLLF